MQVFHFVFILLLSLLGFGSITVAEADSECPHSLDPDCPDEGDFVDPDHPLPANIFVHCSGHQVDEEARIKTMARMMDWCYCGNILNPNGLEYSGFSIYEDGVSLQERNPSRSWVCSKNKRVTCDNIQDWYNAIKQVFKQCGVGWTGYLYDANRQMAWGFETYQDTTFCDNVGWVGSMPGA